jgi:hypothetical protein
LQNAARNSAEWFEHVKRYITMEPEQFTYSLLTRSQRVSHESLRLRDAGYLEGVERWFAAQSDAPAAPPMFTPFTLRGMTWSIASSWRPWTCIRPSMGCRESFIWCTLARARLAAPGW